LGILLNKQEFDVSVALNGKSALSILDQVKPDLIMLDIMMPGMDGFEVCKKIKENPDTQDIPVIFLTARSEKEDLIQGFRCGGIDYLTKPFNKEELIVRVKNHLELKQHRDQLVKTATDLKKTNKKLIESNRLKAEYLNRLNSELSIARNYINSLIPEPYEDTRMKASNLFISSSKIGGDALGYNYIDSDHIAVYLLDISGHGIGSALQSVSAFNMLRFQTLPQTDFRKPEEVLDALNDAFQMTDHNHHYFTIWYMVFNVNTRKLTYAGAGHPPMLIYSENGTNLRIFSKNIVIGSVKHYDFRSEHTMLPLNSSIYLYSDGVFDIEDDKRWTHEDVLDYLEKNHSNDGSELKGYYSEVRKANKSSKLKDDFSMLKVTFY
ncbi:MAG: SpoIIE family protein phosphatase, partial [Bacteroidota bacterium]